MIEIGALDRIELERDAKVSSRMTTAFIKDLVGNGYKSSMKPSKLTDRLSQLRKELEQSGDDVIMDKLEYVMWLNWPLRKC